MSSSDDDDVNVMGTALVRQGPVSETMRMKVGARHELKVAPRDVMPEMPSVRPAPMKTRTLKSQTQAKHNERAYKNLEHVTPMGRPMQETSEHRRQFSVMATSPVRAAKPPRTNLFTGGETRMDTEYRMRFPGHMPPPAAPRIEQKYKPSDVKLHAETETRAAFKNTEYARPEPFKPKSRLHVGGTFFGATESRAAFRDPKGQGRAEAFKPPSTVLPNQRFLGIATSQRSFVKHDLDAARSAAVEAKDRAAREVVDRPFVDPQAGARGGEAFDEDMVSVDSRGYVY